MWIIYNSIEKKTLKGEKGDYDAWVLTATKKGYDGAPDEDWSRKLFESDAAALIEDGKEIPGVSLVDFFKNGVESGDMVEIKQEKDGRFWRIVSMCNMTKGGNRVRPKSYAEAKALADSAAPATAPAAPAAESSDSGSEDGDLPPWMR